MFRFDAPELAAMVDWELASLGDPLLDLGWLIAAWPNDDGTGITPTIEVRPWNGFATIDELIARYAVRS
jgi:aminoglycoside phosphotransferase (APT) family kinase protein